MLRTYHASDLAPASRLSARALPILALSGTLALAAALLFSPLISIANSTAWRWSAGGACLLASFVVAVLAVRLVWQMARRWQFAALQAQQQLLLPQMVTATDPITTAITAPLAPRFPVLLADAATAPHHVGVTAVAEAAPARRVSDHTGALTHEGVHTHAPVVYDPLTGAVAHSALMARLEGDVAFALEHDRPLALAIFDIDHFRTINTLYGYPFGDEVLFAVAERLRRLLTEDALLARLGADRFAVVWSGTPFAQTRALADGILAAVAGEPLVLPRGAEGAHERVRVSLRAGLALCPDDGRSAGALLELATNALHPSPLANVLRDDTAAFVSPQHAPPFPEATFPALADEVESPAATVDAWPASYLDVMLAKNGSIQALASAMEARDIEGIEHARNLAELAQETALLLGRSVEESRLVGLAALLHDVGNLGIPAEILQKTEPLSPEEWAFVREHPHLGQRLLTSVGGVLAAIAPIIAAQRERWDGTGYPLGTRGEAIPLGARIVAVCDVYGALISERPYRPAHSHAEALAELQRCAGTQFDPAVIAAFVSAANA